MYSSKLYWSLFFNRITEELCQLIMSVYHNRINLLPIRGEYQTTEL